MELEEFVKKNSPNLALDMMETVLQHLITVLGVENLDDLSVVQEKDLLKVLPVIKARRLVQNWKCNGNVSLSPSTSHVSSPVAEATPNRSASISWMDTFVLPRARLSKKVNDLLAQGKRLDPASRRDLVRVLVDDIVKVCPRPLKKHTDQIAKQVVEAHFGSLSDQVGGEIVMSGYESLAKQLKARVENIHRKDSATESDSTQMNTRKRKLNYDCVNSEPEDVLSDEMEVSLRAKQDALKIMHQQGESAWVLEEIEEHMKCTYVLQRRDVNACMPITGLNQHWPFLFHEIGLKTHFQLLMKINIHGCLKDSGKVEKLWAFLKENNVKKYLQIFKEVALDVLEDVKESQDPKNVVLPASILSLMAYFAENPDTLFKKADETATASEVHDLPATPCLIFCGSSCCTAKRFMLSIDQVVVNDNCTTFLDGFASLFASYFCINIQYPQAAAATLDFIQRCFFGINPERGSRVEKVEKKKKYALNPKVVTLFQNIADFEWLHQ